MHVLSTLLPVLGLATQLVRASSSYSLEDDFGTGLSFFDNFDFWTLPDPTHGYVQYVDRSTAEHGGLISSTNSSVYMGVDHDNVATDGRQSVRITSKKGYDHGLFILDLAHMPGGTCGTWPAYWLLSRHWPSNGEIDIIEGVHDQSINKMAGHTTSGCSITDTGFTGSLTTSDCYVAAAGQSTNAGCSISDSSSQSYGSGFNDADGGIYATEWTSDAISIWFFARDRIPEDIGRGEPDPSSWGEPSARFGGDCQVDSYYRGMQIVFDTTFCGDWAGATWSTTGCASKASSCEDFVANHPSEFRDAYWSINSLRVYQQGTSSSSSDSPKEKRMEREVRPSGFAKVHRRGRHHAA